MQIEVKFHGPYSADLAEAYNVEVQAPGWDFQYVGKGENKAVAATRAVSALANSPNSEYLSPVLDYVYAQLPIDGLALEADDTTHSVYCVVRFNP